MNDIFGCVLMVAITFPLSFFVARACLKGVIRLGALGETARSVAPRAAPRREFQARGVVH
jgi:hypothetical protein